MAGAMLAKVSAAHPIPTDLEQLRRGSRACCVQLPWGLRNKPLRDSQVFLVKRLTAHRHRPQPIFSGLYRVFLPLSD